MTVRLVFIDSHVAEYQSLIPQLPANVEVVVLEKHHDGVSQILTCLQSRTGIPAVGFC